MTEPRDFHAGYAAALRTYLEARGEEDLAVGHELGRRALQERISMLDIIENHSWLINELAQSRSGVDLVAALGFLLQTLARSTLQPADFSMAQSVTKNSGPAPRIWPTATSSAPPW